MAALGLFSDIGLGPNIVRSPRGDDPQFLDTAWTLQVARGLILWIGSSLIAIPLAWFYAMPQLARMLPVVGLSAVVTGLNSTAVPLSNRHMRLGRLTILDLATQIVTLAATIPIALAHRSAWALILGGLVGLVFRMVVSHLALGGPPNRFHWEPEAARELFGFGKWILLNTAMTFLAMQADRIILGKLMSLASSGSTPLQALSPSFLAMS